MRRRYASYCNAILYYNAMNSKRMRIQDYYREIFSQVSVILSMGVGVYPSMHWGRHPLGRQLPGQTPPGQTPAPPGRHLLLPPADTTPPHPVHAGIHAPPPAATAADGRHPTGMHSCFICYFHRYMVHN